MNDEKYSKFLRISGYASGLFTLFVALMMILGYFQLESIKPLDNPALELLKEQYDADQNNESLKQQLRALDLMSRRAFFASRWQIDTGKWLLLIGVCIFFISQRLLIHNKRRTLDKPLEEFDLLGKSKKTRIYLGTASILIITLAFIISFSIRRNIPNPSSVEQEHVSEASNQTMASMSNDNRATLSGINDTSPKYVSDASSNNETNDDVSNNELSKEQSNDEPTGQVSDIRQKSNFPSFRGQGSRGIAPSGSYPTNWNGKTGKNIKWKVNIPHRGYSSPIIWGDKIFCTGADGEALYLMCFGKSSGELLWDKAAFGVDGEPTTPPKTTEDTGLAAPTAATNGKLVCAIFANGNLLAFDFEGKRLWAKNLGVPENHYGHSSSLIIHNDILIVQYDHFKSKSIIAFNALTGKKLWETLRSVAISWASPVVAKLNGITQVILNSEPNVISYNIQTGKELWSVKCMSGEVGPSVAVNSKYVFAVNDFAVLAAIDPANGGKILWQDNEYTPEVASPLATETLVYVLTTWGGVACYDANTGAIVWNHDFDYGFYSSPILANGLVYMLDQAGVMHIIKDDKAFKLIDECVLGERANCTPAFSDGGIFIRTDKHLYCIGE